MSSGRPTDGRHARPRRRRHAVAGDRIGAGTDVRHRHRHHLRTVRIPGCPRQFRRYRHGPHQGDRRGSGLQRRHQAAGFRRGTAGRPGEPGRRRHRRHVDHRRTQAGIRLLRTLFRVRRADGGAGRQRGRQVVRRLERQAGVGQERHAGFGFRQLDQGQVRLRSGLVRRLLDDVRRGQDRQLRGSLRGLPGAALRHRAGQRLQDRYAQRGSDRLRVRGQQGPERGTAVEVQRGPEQPARVGQVRRDRQQLPRRRGHHRRHLVPRA